MTVTLASYVDVIIIYFINRILILGKLNNLVKEWIREISEIKVGIFLFI